MANKKNNLPLRAALRAAKGTNGGIERRFNRSFAEHARVAGVPAEILVRILEVWMRGRIPTVKTTRELADEPGKWVTDPEHKPVDRFHVAWAKDGLRATPEQQQWAWTQMRQAGYGMPAQSLHIDAEMRATSTSIDVDVAQLANLPPAAVIQMMAALRGALAPAAPTTALAPTPPTPTKTLTPPPPEEPEDE